MASIAYVTDNTMVEFHRLNGNRNINFWKPSNLKKFSEFRQGDYLFFLAKGSEKGKKREKGIVGYGRFEKAHTMKFQTMWNKYETLNGYPTKESLEEAICKLMKDKCLPDMISCLELSGVTFFQYPIYLSELGIEISNRIESYIYLDKEGNIISNKILEKADSFGVDLWSSMIQGDGIDKIAQDAKISMIHAIYDKMKENSINQTDMKKSIALQNQYRQNNNHCISISGSSTDFIQTKNNKIVIYIPYVQLLKEQSQKLQYMIGRYMLYQTHLKKEKLDQDVEVRFLIDQELEIETLNIIVNLNLSYEIIK